MTPSEYQGPGAGTLDTFTPDNLHAGDFPIVTEDVVVAEGHNVPRGAVVGRVTATGEVRLSLSASEDGSEVPYAIMGNSVDASEAARPGFVYLTGEFNTRRVTIGAGHTAASIRAALRAVSIYLKNSVAAG